MKISQFFNGSDLRDFFYVSGSHGLMSGSADVVETGSLSTVSGAYKGLYAESSFCADASGILSRTGFMKNLSDAPIQIHTALSSFLFDGGEYEVYTQYSGWQNESMGSWQPLVTAVTAANDSPRACSCASPMLAIWNVQTQRGLAFHLIAEGSWEMTAHRVKSDGESADVTVEIGMRTRSYSVCIAPQETVALPEVLICPFTRKIDMDAWKLHRYLIRRFPMREMPVIYNTWMYHYDDISYEMLARQVPKAAEIGAEYFVVDAGWFGVGKADWSELRGDWFENETANLCGSMKQLADDVRAHGMKFGFWLETESAGRKANIVREHPEFFLRDGGRVFLDFTNPDAAEYLFSTVCALIEKYGAEFLKFDYNQDLREDMSFTSFHAYAEAYDRYIARIRAAHPEVYIQCCASGGLRMDIGNCRNFDSFWPSDNHSPYEGMRIVKETILRLPPQRLERWNCLTSYAATQPFDEDKLFASHDCGWHRMVSVYPSFLHAYMTGGPIGLSFDLHRLSDKAFADLRDFIANFKKERSYWSGAECRILTDTPTMLVLQYSDNGLQDVRVQAISNKIRQKNIRVYPVLDVSSTYALEDGTAVSGAELSQSGISVHLDGDDSMTQLVFRKIK